MYTLLDSAAFPTWRIAAYEMLNKLLHSDVSEMVLRYRTPELSPLKVERLSLLLDADPIVRRARRLTHENVYRNSLSTLVTLLRLCNVIADLAALPDGAMRRAIARRAKADFARLSFPVTSLPVPQGWWRLPTVGDLWEYAARMQLCVAPGSYGCGDATVSALMGRSVFLHCVGSDALAQVGAVPGGAWIVEQVAIARNRRLPCGIASGLHDELTAAGAVLLPGTPQGSLDTILRLLRKEQGRWRSPH